MREGLLGFLLITAIGLQACLVEIPTARAGAVRAIEASKALPGDSRVQQPEAKIALARAFLLISEIKVLAYPELRGVRIQEKLFESKSDYFRARFALPPFFNGRQMRYLIFVNDQVFKRQAPTAGVHAIIAHELAHVLYFSQRNRLQLLGLVRLATKGFTARFERWADLQAIARGYGAGLKEYRQWLYRNIPARSLEEKKRDYFSPEEIDAIVAATQKRPELFAYWFKHVPMNLKEILAEKSATDKR
jgi:Zn-dependent protease with chaperone function